MLKTVYATLQHVLFGAWFILVFVVCALLCLFGVALLPGLQRRQRLVRRLTRVIFVLTGLGPDIEGLDHLPSGPCVVAANHASYLDGVVMTAVLPPRFSFVIKGEMRGVPLAGYLLRRIDSFFVDRASANHKAVSARSIIRAAQSGRALGVFPEGTFIDVPGLQRFHRGAFAVAKAGRMPVVPAVIRGTRDVLRAGNWWPKPGRIHVELLPPIPSDVVVAADATTLTEQVRKAILAKVGEPDALLPEPSAVRGDTSATAGL